MKRINTILVANRGEIAARVMRTCKKMGIRSVAVYSDADQHAPYLKHADLAVYIGESEPSASYLDGDKLIEVAKQHSVDAIHPGYGFLAENAGFAKAVEKAGMSFIGPNPKAIELMGSKSKAKALMQKHKVPTVPGYQGGKQDVKTLKAEAEKIGYPVLLKAVAGGGGKGMRIVEKADLFEREIEAAKREAMSAFGDDEMILEKYFSSARHIEFQIFGDQHGNAIHVLERECSIQRRYQKVIEESPSPVLDEKTRKAMGEAAVNAAKALNYDNAGTVEFIYVGKGEYYFLEVNTRLQVEHPVTEMVTGLDLVKMQIEVEEGKPLEVKQEDISHNGYAIECRLYAEDPAHDFLPATGKLRQWSVPCVDGIRVDTGVESGSEISIYYDPMIAKIIAHGADRQEAIRRMRYCLENTLCSGLITNQGFLIRLLSDGEFIEGKYDTGFIATKPELCKESSSEAELIVCMGIAIKQRAKRAANRNHLKHIPQGWRNNFYQAQQRKFMIGERELSLEYVASKDGLVFKSNDTEYVVKNIEINDSSIIMQVNGLQHKLHLTNEADRWFAHHPMTGSLVVEKLPRFPEANREDVKGGYIAPMPAQVIKVMVDAGADVKSGDGLVVLSSMKMENTIYADGDGKVEEIFVSEGENIEAGMLLLKLNEE